MTRWSKWRGLTTVMVASLFTVAACGGGGSSNSGGQTETTAAGQTTAPGGTTSPGGTPAAPKGTLRLGSFVDATTFDPHQAQYTLSAYMSPVYDTLVRTDAAGKLVPGLATDWQRVDAATWSFKLRDDVTFHDGTAFDAEAVKANLERARDTKTNPQGGEFRNIDQVTVVSPTELTVHFSSPHPEFPSVLATLAGSMVSPKAMNETLAKNPVGTGGWKYDASKSQPGVKYTFVANPDYWDKASQGVENVEVTVLGDNAARHNALKAGQIDIMDFVQTTQVAGLEAAGLKTVSAAAGQNAFFIIGDRDGTLVPALGEEKVLQALSYAMNRESYIKNLQAGRGTPTAALWPAGSKWASKENEQLYAYDAEKARTLLADAGYGSGLKIPVPVFATTQTANEIAAQMLKDVGVELTLEPVEPGTAGRLFREKRYPMVYGPVVVSNPYSFWATYVASQGGWNPFGVDTSQIDAVAKQAAESLDEAEQTKLYQQMEKMILDTGMFMSFGQVDLIAGLSPKVKGTPIIRVGERMPVPLGLTVS